MERKNLHKKKYTPSKEELRHAIIEKMKELLLWEDLLIEEIPSCWNNFDNYIVFNAKYFTSPQWAKAGSIFWEHVSALFCGKSVALQGKISNDDFRSPNVRIVHGSSPWVTLLDNAIWFTWNIEYTMFCTGNVSERHRVANFTCTGETIVDMFAGIGYFTLPYLVHTKAKHVFACEWNPKSVEALKSNLVKNNVADKCTILEGDVNIVAPRGLADRINLGLIPSCEQYWPTAAEILKSSGGNLHVHGNVTSLASSQGNTKCETCVNLLQILSVDTTDSAVKGVGGFEVGSVALNGLSINGTDKNEQKLKWKRHEWFVWAVHACHSFCHYLTRRTGTVWSVRPLFLHRVKAYAPHIDHLVVDISCQNLFKPLNNDLSVESPS